VFIATEAGQSNIVEDKQEWRSTNRGKKEDGKQNEKRERENY